MSTPSLSNMLMLSWVVGALPTSRQQAIICSASSVGYCALGGSLGSLEYPQHTILLTNGDIRDVLDVAAVVAPPEGAPYSYIVRVPKFAKPHAIQRLLNTPIYYYESDGALLQSPYRTRKDRWNRDCVEYGVTYQMANCRTHLSPISNITTLPPNFLSCCAGLESISIVSMPCITTIGEGDFLSGCTALETLDLSPLQSVCEIPQGFLKGCTSLKEIDFSPMSNVTSIGEDFLMSCTSLKSINFNGLGKVRQLKNRFMFGCTALTVVDMAPLAKVCAVSQQMYFHPLEIFAGCTNLVTVLNPPRDLPPSPSFEMRHWGRKQDPTPTPQSGFRTAF